jgi:hypothetical protein
MQGHPGTGGMQVSGDLRTDAAGTACHQHDGRNGVCVHEDLSQEEIDGARVIRPW